MTQSSDESRRRKQQLRVAARARRRCLANKDALSEQICRRVVALPEYARAGTVLFYVDVRSEVRTRAMFPLAWRQGKRVAVPYCVGDRLDLFHLYRFDDLAPGTFGVEEPKLPLRERADRRVELNEVDLVVVPGVAFDRTGGRVGYGKGYYDRLLAGVRPDAMLVALAFECQLVDDVGAQPYDVPVDLVITENDVYVRPGE